MRRQAEWLGWAVILCAGIYFGAHVLLAVIAAVF